MLKHDKEIMWFPVISGILTLLLFVSFIIPLGLLAIGSEFTGTIEPFYYGMLFLFYLGSYFIVIFFNTALIACADKRLHGGDPTVKYGLQKAWEHVGQIFIWSLISATVGLVLRIILDKLQDSDKLGIVGKIVGSIVVSLIGMAWTFLTYFVVPVIIFEKMSVFQSIKRSGQLFKKTWGESVIGQFSIGGAFALLYLVGVGVIILGFMSGSLSVILVTFSVAVVYMILLGILSSTLNGIFTTALYHYAKTGQVPSLYTKDTIEHAFKPRKKGLF